jgi:type II secretory pathway pseudopilin PulG
MSQAQRPSLYRHLFTRRFALFVTGAVVLILLLAILWPAKPSAASTALDAKLAQLRADGVPLTAAEIATALPDPDAEHDAHLILRDAFAVPRGPAGGDIPFLGGTMPKRTEPFSDSVMQSINRCLSQSDTMLQKIPERLDGVRFSMGWTNGFTNLKNVPIVEVRHLIQALAIKAVFEAERGDAPKAAEALRKGFSVTTTLNSDSLVSTMIRVACADIMCTATERALNRIKLGDSDLEQIYEQIDIERIDNFAPTFIAERHMGMLVLDPAREGRNYFNDRPFEVLLWKFAQFFRRDKRKFYRDEDYLTFLNVIDERQAAHRLSGRERVRRNEALAAYYTTNTRSLVAEMVMPNWKKAMRTATETKARLTALKVALAVERYRLAHANTVPDTLDVLVPQFLPSPPRDPMDDQPLRFKKLPRGCVVYSVGADGIDDAGTERGSLTNNYDIPITIER